jgi:hypothetical protein
MGMEIGALHIKERKQTDDAREQNSEELDLRGRKQQGSG